MLRPEIGDFTPKNGTVDLLNTEVCTILKTRFGDFTPKNGTVDLLKYVPTLPFSQQFQHFASRGIPVIYRILLTVTRHYYEDTGKRTGQFGLFKDTKGCLEEYPKMYGHNVTVVHVFLLISADINLWRVQVQYGCLLRPRDVSAPGVSNRIQDDGDQKECRFDVLLF